MSADDQSASADHRRRWSGGWRRYLFPGIWLVYLVQTIGGIGEHSSGVAEVIGYVILGVYAIGYMIALPAGWSGDTRRFRQVFVVMVLLSLAEIPLAHEDAFVMWVYIGVLVVAGFRRFALPAIAVMTAVAVVLPKLVTSWHADFDWDMLLTLPLVGLAMYGFFSIIATNKALAEARTEVVRLAAENERSRIARDLHDLLGHSLTTITVKAGLARKLAERETVDGAQSRTAREIAEVEAVARRSLTEVRAAVAGFADVSLAGEIATAREVLRAAAIDADVPRAVDTVDPVRSELFGWVVREAVTNVVRHTRAQRCVITAGPTWVEVRDDGFGASDRPPADGAVSDGHGLSGLCARIEAAGGTLHVGRVAGGWRVRAEVPDAPVAAAAPTVTDRDLFRPPERTVR
ncbi:sensor histidine kinase [Jatrophihabitans sp. YIM 134969]